MQNRNWTRISLNKVPERSFWIGLLIATAYVSYRYPLQINSSTTSQVYSDTPLSLQAGKFALIFLTCCISAPFLFWKRLNRHQAGIVILTAIVFSFPLFKLLGGVESRYLEISFWPLAALVLTIPLRNIELRSIDSYLKVLFFFAVISDAIEVSLFVLVGRLPALGWSGGFSVRFGGFLDDPNGFGAILLLLMGWSFYRFKGKRRFFAQFALIICLLLTQSLTAIGFLGVVILAAIIWRVIKKPLFLVWIFAGSIALFALMEATHLLEAIALVVALKSRSASDHLSIPWGSLIDRWTEWFFVGERGYEFYESWWVSSFLSFGVVWYVGYLILMFVLLHAVWRSYRLCASEKEKAVLAGILLFCIYFVVGSANLPLPIVFPINFLFYTFCFLIAFRKTATDTHTRSLLSGTAPSAIVRV